MPPCLREPNVSYHIKTGDLHFSQICRTAPQFLHPHTRVIQLSPVCRHDLVLKSSETLPTEMQSIRCVEVHNLVSPSILPCPCVFAPHYLGQLLLPAVGHVHPVLHTLNPPTAPESHSDSVTNSPNPVQCQPRIDRSNS